MVHPVFGHEERAGFAAVALAAFREHADVTACAEAPAIGMIENDAGNVLVPVEFIERVEDARAHVGRQRVERLGTVKPDAADAALGG